MDNPCKIVTCPPQDDYGVYSLAGEALQYGPHDNVSLVECRTVTCPPDDDYGAYELQDQGPIPPGQNFLNNPASYCQECPEGEVLQYTGNLPFWLSINDETDCLTAAGGIIHGATQEDADEAIQIMLDNFVAGAVATGSLDCEGGLSFVFIPGDSGGAFVPAAGVATGSIYFFIAAQFYSTPDGVVLTPLGSTVIQPTCAAFGAGLFVAAGGLNGLETSPDGNIWTPRTAAVAQGMQGIVFANGLFVAVGDAANSQSSPDGINWTSNPTGGGGTDHLRCITYGSGLYVACGNNGVIFTSPDAITWTPRASGVFNPEIITDIATDGTNFVAVTTDPFLRLLTSPDGINWTGHALASGAKSIAFGASTWAVGNGNDEFWISPDGINYTLAEISPDPTREIFFAYFFSPSTFVGLEGPPT